jgi:hypothetical protein
MIVKIGRLLLFAAALCQLSLTRAAASAPFGFDTSLNVYTEDPYSKLPLKSVDSVTKIEGAIAATHIVYTFIDGLSQVMEVGVNFKLPEQSVLDGFGYYYGSRFIRGKIYTNDQAWQIYTAVTSRGRDPGIMDRPDAQDYHTQIYPVLPGQNLRVVVDIVQELPVHGGVAKFTLPLQQDDEITSATDVNAKVTIAGIADQNINSNFDGYTSSTTSAGSTVMTLNGSWLPKENWILNLPLQIPQKLLTFSRLDNNGHGGFAATVVLPWSTSFARITSINGPGVSLVMPMKFTDVHRNDGISFVGRYDKPGVCQLTIRGSRDKRLTVKFNLEAQYAIDPQNPASKLWADKRIGAMQDEPAANKQSDVVDLSKCYTIVSNFTALLAIPPEELARYRRLMAEQSAHSNTNTIGGGGGDPFISVKAPEDAKQVVAVFPDGSAKSLEYDISRNSWTTRFDFPLGTPAGNYVVTIIVTQANGKRTQLILTYDNLITAPKVKAAAHIVNLDNDRQAHVEVNGDNIARATLVAPWGERAAMMKDGVNWTGVVTAPPDWPAGAVSLSVVCYDGAHNRSEVQVDVDVR